MRFWVLDETISADAHRSASYAIFKALAVPSLASGLLAPAAPAVNHLGRTVQRIDEPGFESVVVDYRGVMHHEGAFRLMVVVVEAALALTLGVTHESVHEARAVKAQASALGTRADVLGYREKVGGGPFIGLLGRFGT